MPSSEAQDEGAAFGWVVANPYRVKKGERIFSWEEDEWFEGDPLGPHGMPPDMVEWLIEEGILVRGRQAPVSDD